MITRFVLIEWSVDPEGMEIALVIFFVVVGPLALLRGADSRLDERKRLPEWRRFQRERGPRDGSARGSPPDSRGPSRGAARRLTAPRLRRVEIRPATCSMCSGMDTGSPASALVTGASGGIGAACARAFSSEGAQLVLHYHRGRERAAAVAADCGRAGTVRAGEPDPRGGGRQPSTRRGPLSVGSTCASRSPASGRKRTSRSGA